MGTGYTKTDPTNFVDGETIQASDFTTEFNAIDSAFTTSGHQHDGTDGEGGAIEKLLSNAITFGTGADTDIAITFNANTSDGVLTWMEDEDYFQFSDDILLTTTEKLQFRDTAIYINSSTDGQLDLVADTEIQIAATTIDVNGNLDVSGTIVSGGTLTATTSIGIGSAVLSEAELETLDGITAGTAAASKAVVLDANKDIATVRNVTSNGTVQFGSLSDGSITITAFVDEDDMSSNSATLVPTQQSVKAFVEGSAQTMGDGFVLEDGDGTEVTITENKEVKFVEGGGIDIDWTDTDNGTDADPYDLTFTIVAAQTGITSVTNTSLVIGRDADNDIDFATDNNIIFRAAGTDQIKLIDGVLAPVTDNGVDLGSSSLQFKDAFIHGTLEADAITIGGTAIAAAGTSSITTVGALNSGSITSGFGTINNGSSAITTTGAVSGGSFVVPDDGDIGSASATDAIQISSAGIVTFKDDILIKDGGTIGVASTADAMTVSSAGIVTFKDDILIKDGGTIGVASAADAMTVSSAGIVTFKDDILIKDGGTIGVASDADVITIASTGVTTFSKAVVGKSDTDTSNTGSVTLDFQANQNFILTFTGNVTLANPSTEAVGQTGVIVCIQDGTGSRTLSLGTDYETVGGAGITLSTAASAVDVIPYFVKASGSIQLGAPQLAFS